MTAAKSTKPKAPAANNKKPLISEKMVEEIGNFLLSGCHLIDAALLVDISERTLRNYRTRGRAEAQRIEEGGRPIAAEALYLKLWQVTQKRRTERKLRAMTKLQDLMNSQDENVALKAITWYLERGWPDEFGRRTRIEENEHRPDSGEATDPEKLRREAFAALDELADRRSRKTG